jgi:hypothetical protein
LGEALFAAKFGCIVKDEIENGICCRTISSADIRDGINRVTTAKRKSRDDFIHRGF